MDRQEETNATPNPEMNPESGQRLWIPTSLDRVKLKDALSGLTSPVEDLETFGS